MVGRRQYEIGRRKFHIWHFSTFPYRIVTRLLFLILLCRSWYCWSCYYRSAYISVFLPGSLATAAAAAAGECVYPYKFTAAYDAYNVDAMEICSRIQWDALRYPTGWYAVWAVFSILHSICMRIYVVEPCMCSGIIHMHIEGIHRAALNSEHAAY